MRKVTPDELRTAGANLREFVEMRGGKWDASMFDALGRDVAHLSEAEFYAALQRCEQTPCAQCMGYGRAQRVGMVVDLDRGRHPGQVAAGAYPVREPECCMDRA